MGQVADGAEVVEETGDPTPPEEPTPTTAQQMADDLRAMTDDSGTTPSVDAGTGDAGEGAGDPTPPAPPSGETGTPTPAVEVIDIGGFQIPVDQTDAVVSLLEWASSLTEEQAAAAFAAASGQPLPPAGSGAAAPPPPEDPPAPTSSIPDEVRSSYPEVAVVMERMEQEIAALRGEVEPRIEQVEMIAGHEAMTRQQREVAETEIKVQQAFLHEHSLTEDEYMKVTATVGRLGIVPTLVEQFGVEDGFKKALEIGYTATPEFRDRDIQAAIRAQETTDKKARAGSLTPQGGSAPRVNTTPAGLPQSERKSAMIADIEQLLGG